MSEIRINGIAVSAGIKIGKALVSFDKSLEEKINEDLISEEEIENLLKYFEIVKAEALDDLNILVKETHEKLGSDKAAILEVQKELLNDPIINAEVHKRIIENRYNLERAIKDVIHKFVDQFLNMENEYFRDRASDIKDLGKRLLKIINGKKGILPLNMMGNSILVTDDITPSEAVQLNKGNILAFITKHGGRTSHSVFIARSLKIPAIVGLGDKIDKIEEGNTLIIDGDSGTIIINPETSTIEEFKAKIKDEEEPNILSSNNSLVVTKDGIQIQITANIANKEEALLAKESGIEGIGLLRTEFLFMNHQNPPSEEEQYLIYKEIASSMNDKPIIFRTFDIGGDKSIPFAKIPKEANPFLGYRGIRISLDNKDLLTTQLKAILRASIYGNFMIMFPMISTKQEVKQVNAILNDVKNELELNHVPFDNNIKIGIMIEVPSAAIMAEQLAKEIDFFSIGTNDLIQYTFAADRNNEKVSYLYDSFHPAFIQLLNTTLDGARKSNIPTKICGQMASNLVAIPLLVGLGFKEFSIELSSQYEVKELISKLNHQSCGKLADRILQLDSRDEIWSELMEFHNQLENAINH